jgi:ribA/ribD-fused uncharacterized protein
MIDSFTGDYEFLSNFYPSLIEVRVPGARAVEKWYAATVEHGFQAAKTEDSDQMVWVLSAPKAGEAKRRGRQVTLRSDWEDQKVLVMLELLRKKFSPDNSVEPGGPLTEKLLATGYEELVEGNTWGDTYWGVDVNRGRGNNVLGECLMLVRQELRVSRFISVTD